MLLSVRPSALIVIATNANVARDEGSLITILPDGQHLEAKVVYIDEDLDVALVRFLGKTFRTSRSSMRRRSGEAKVSSPLAIPGAHAIQSHHAGGIPLMRRQIQH
jgi:S1-C subfamily serine protease